MVAKFNFQLIFYLNTGKLRKLNTNDCLSLHACQVSTNTWHSAGTHGTVILKTLAVRTEKFGKTRELSAAGDIGPRGCIRTEVTFLFSSNNTIQRNA